jgi:uncharacterized protein (TIGR02145 family)
MLCVFSTGFGALPNGYAYFDGSPGYFYLKIGSAIFWTSTTEDAGYYDPNYIIRKMSSGTGITRDELDANISTTVRCVKD